MRMQKRREIKLHKTFANHHYNQQDLQTHITQLIEILGDLHVLIFGVIIVETRISFHRHT